MHSFAFVSQISIDTGITPGYGLSKRLEAVKGCRNIGKKDMKWNSLCPDIHVDSETYCVSVDGVEIGVDPANELPLSQNVYLF